MGHYDELLKEVRKRAESFRLTAVQFIPKMYEALRNENPNTTPQDARDRIEKDCIGIWSKRTILEALPDEAKNLEKQNFGRLGQKKRCSAAESAASFGERILIDTNGKAIENEAPSTTVLPSMSFMSDRDNEGNCPSSDDCNRPKNIDLLQFEFAFGSNEIFNHAFFSSEKQIWFCGTIDKITGKVITVSIGRISDTHRMKDKS